MKERLDWVDGLRGIAVLGVVLFHAIPSFSPGSLGVSLFFVLSGFCLAWGPLSRQNSGVARWFLLRRYALARCRRILPPYFAALVLFTALNIAFVAAHLTWPGQGQDAQFSAGSVLAHIVLIQNLNSHWLFGIDGPMWSLATEWQWYFLFPVLLLSCCRWPRFTLTVALVVSAGWAALVTWPSPMHGTELVPARLFEFFCGIAAARIVVSGRRVPTWVLVAGVFNWMLLARAAPFLIGLTHTSFPLYGVSFGSAIVMASQPGLWRRLCTARPLVWLGLRSYSVYLIHVPIVAGTMTILGWSAWYAAALAVGLALVAGASFFEMFERPWLRPARTAEVAPRTLALAGNA